MTLYKLHQIDIMKPDHRDDIEKPNISSKEELWEVTKKFLSHRGEHSVVGNESQGSINAILKMK